MNLSEKGWSWRPADSTRLWGGRFAEGPSDAMAALSLSTHFDWRLAPYDLAQTRVHAHVLARAGLISDGDRSRIVSAIDELSAEVVDGTAAPIAADEDVHTAIERLLMDKLGDLGGALRAGRSRNDQVATDFRLYLRDAARVIAQATLDLVEALNAQATQHLHGVSRIHALATRTTGVLRTRIAKHSHALLRDVDRLADWDDRTHDHP